MLLTVLQWVLIVLGVLAAAGTLLSLHGGSHWFVRLWDFPRVQIATVAGAAGVGYGVLFFQRRPLEWVFLAATLLVVLWQGWKIFPYTPLARVRVKLSAHPPRTDAERAKRATLRLVISNVLMENRKHDLLLSVLRAADADVILTVETDDAWARALEPLSESHPYVVRQPQNNYYGLMLFSRFPLIESRVDFMVQDDIPSVHAVFELPSGDHVLLHGLHPRPPEPIRDQDSTPRDAELVLMGTSIRDADDRPTLVAGDLNDVAWSPTSELFLRLSGLLDPRMGRGFYNSYNANNPFFRYPLDHVFHSNHFRLCELRRLPHVGSDHFPMLVELSYEPDAPIEQPKTAEAPGDDEEAEEKIEREVEAAATGDDRPGRE